MSKGNNNNEVSENAKTEADFHQAAVINEKGEEVAITEEMVREAILELDKDAYLQTGQESGQK